MRDPYDVLGVSRTASEEEIKSAFRRLARDHHPDTNPGDSDAERRFQELNAAYQVLSDPNRRARFDRMGDGARPEPGFARGAPTDLQDFLRDLFGGFAAQPIDRGDLRATVEISFQDAAHGCKKTLRYERSDHCPDCSGRGHEAGRSCVRCGGSGLVVKQLEIDISLPAGIEHGATQMVEGAGHRTRAGRPAGDLDLVIQVRPDPRFRRDGDDVYGEVDAGFVVCALGGVVRVETVFGDEPLNVPAGTQHGELLRLRGRGIPHRFRSGHGDHYVRMRVRVPGVQTERARSLVSEYDEAMRESDGFFDRVRSWLAG